MSLACDKLGDPKIAPWKTEETLKALKTSLPRGLDDIYQPMLKLVRSEGEDDFEFYRHIISAALTVFRPISLGEPLSLANFTDGAVDDESLTDIIMRCGSLLTLREDDIYFAHSSARKVLSESANDLLCDEGETHQTIFSNSHQVLSDSLDSD